MKYGVFYGSTTGNTEAAAEAIAEQLGESTLLKDVTEATPADFGSVDVILCGASTWDIGELQYDWAKLLPKLKNLDLQGKAIAFFGMGDAIGYPYNYLDCLGELWETLQHTGARLVGRRPTDGYTFDESRAETEPGWLVGLGLDDDNEPELTEPRIKQWLAQVLLELAALPNASASAAST